MAPHAVIVALLTSLHRIGSSAWCPLLFLGIAGLWLTASMPYVLLLVIGGLLFGPLRAIPLNVAALAVGSSGAYALARVLGPRLTAHRTIGRLAPRLRDASLASLVGVRMLPLVPFGGTSYAAGVARVPFARFALSTLVGIAPQAVVTTVLSAEIARGSAHAVRLTAILSGVLTCLAGAAMLAARARRRRSTAPRREPPDASAATALSS